MSNSRSMYGALATVLSGLLIATIASGCRSPQIPAMNSAGSRPVGHRVVVLAKDPSRSVSIDVWYPAHPNRSRRAFYPLARTPMGSLGLQSSISAEGAMPATDRMASLILFSHGNPGLGIDAIRMMETLASHGFVVLAPTHGGSSARDLRAGSLAPTTISADRRADLKCILEAFCSKTPPPSMEWFRTIQIKNIGMIGESYGARTVLDWTLEHPESLPPVRALMCVAPSVHNLDPGKIGRIRMPLMVVGGGLDEITPMQSCGDVLYQSFSNAPAYRIVFDRATHYHFMNIVDIGTALKNAGINEWLWNWIGASKLSHPYQECTKPGSASANEVQADLCAFSSAFFRLYLHDDPSALNSLKSFRRDGVTVKKRDLESLR